MPNEAAAANEKPVVAVGTHTPRLLTRADFARQAVADKLAVIERLPPGFPDTAHRIDLSHALAACGVTADHRKAVGAAREFLALPNRGLL
jgi:hypothetical protein